MNNNILGTRLKERRLQKGLKQADVAGKIGCAPTSLTNYERGIIKPPLGVLPKLCKILDLSPLELLSDKYDFNGILEVLKKPVDERSYEEEVAINFSYPIFEGLTSAALKRLEKERENQEYISSRTGLSATALAALGVDTERKISSQGLAVLNELLSCEQGLTALNSVDICLQVVDSSTIADDVQILGFMIFTCAAIYQRSLATKHKQQN